LLIFQIISSATESTNSSEFLDEQFSSKNQIHNQIHYDTTNSFG